MADEGAYSASQELLFTADEGSQNSEDLLMAEGDSYECHDHDSCGQQVVESEGNGLGNEYLGPQLLDTHCNEPENCTLKLLETENTDHGNELALQSEGSNHANGSLDVLESEDSVQLHAPVTGMEFGSYGDAYSYYNSYAKELGFAIRVKSSWTRRNSKEKRGAVLCCNCEGFKTAKESTSRRKETRTGCLAMIRLRLADTNIWRVDEVKLDHNHSFDPERALNSKSHKKIQVEAKRNPEPLLDDVEVRTIKLYCTPASDHHRRIGIDIQSNCLKLKEEDIQAIHDYLCQAQLGKPNFMYLMDLNDEGQLKNVFWIDSSRYFGDVVAIETTYLSSKCEVLLAAFVGVNEHLQPILLGCSFLVDQSVEVYVWVLRAWVTCMVGRAPQTVITDEGEAIQVAISEVFPRANHRLAVPLVVQRVFEKVGPAKGFQAAFERTVYGSVRVDEFEASWGSMIERFGMEGLEWLQSLYEDRERWAPVYLKDSFLAGLFTSPAAAVHVFGFGRVHQGTSVRQFLDIHEALFVQETPAAGAGPHPHPHPYWVQLSKLYTEEVLSKFTAEVEMMSSCVSIVSEASGAVTTYIIKEGQRSFEAMYDKAASEVRCLCACFSLYGYLCRHALCVLHCNGLQHIPPHYILPRFTKCSYLLNPPSLPFLTDPIQCYLHLYKTAMHLIQQGLLSPDHYTLVCQAFTDSLNNLRNPNNRL